MRNDVVIWVFCRIWRCLFIARQVVGQAMTTELTNHCRKAFEAWYSKKHQYDPIRDGDSYEYSAGRRSWECWQAAWRACNPTGHAMWCGWQLDQYVQECNCGYKRSEYLVKEGEEKC